MQSFTQEWQNITHRVANLFALDVTFTLQSKSRGCHILYLFVINASLGIIIFI